MSDVTLQENSNVRLKSGGPVMLYSHYTAPLKAGWASWPSPSGCYCIWFDSAGLKHADWFNPDHIVPA